MVRVISAQPRKQRKARYTAHAHQRGRFLHAALSKTLREQYKRRSCRVVKGDTVKLSRGEAAGEEGVVDQVDMKNFKIVVHGISSLKADGTEVPRPIDPSNVQITKLNLKDERREARIEGRKE